MTYDDILAMFMTPPAEPIPTPQVPSTPARRLRDALEPIATQGWWSRAASDRYAALGLDFFGAYVWGRAAALGEPDASVVVATFGVFEATFLTSVYDQARSSTSRAEVLAAREDGAVEQLASMVSAADAQAIAEPLLEALSRLDGMGRPLFSGLRSLPTPATAHGRLWRAAELVREHRGDGHLAACVSAGLDAVEANVSTELWLGYGLGEYSGTRAFSAERLQVAVDSLERRGWASGTTLTPVGLAARLAIEDVTDRSQDGLLVALGDQIETVISAAAAVGAAVVDERSFPIDPRKRAAG